MANVGRFERSEVKRVDGTKIEPDRLLRLIDDAQPNRLQPLGRHADAKGAMAFAAPEHGGVDRHPAFGLRLHAVGPGPLGGSGLIGYGENSLEHGATCMVIRCVCQSPFGEKSCDGPRGRDAV